MRKIISVVLLVAFFACERTSKEPYQLEKERLTQIQRDSVLEKFKFNYESPILLDSSNIVVVPISTQFLKRRKTYSLDGYESNEFPRYWNVAFYNDITRERKLLTNKKFRISVIDTESFMFEKQREKSKILYRIGVVDYNLDGKLSGKDPDFLFASNIDGSRLQQISPVNEHLDDYRVPKGTTHIIFSTIKDINNDSIFDGRDQTFWYKAELEGESWRVDEMVDDSLQKKIESQYFDLWLTK